MAGERQLVPLRANPNLIEGEITGGLGFHDSNTATFSPKGVEHFLSLRIHLAEMDQHTKGLLSSQKMQLTGLKTWRNEIAGAGVEENIRFYNLNGLNDAFDRYRKNKYDKPAPQPRQDILDAARKYWRLKENMRWARDLVISGTATAALATLSAFLWYNHEADRVNAYETRDAAVSQLEDMQKQYDTTPSQDEKQQIVQTAIPIVKTGRDATDELNDIDDWNSVGRTAEGLGLLLAPVATIIAGVFTLTAERQKSPF